MKAVDDVTLKLYEEMQIYHDFVISVLVITFVFVFGWKMNHHSPVSS